MHIYGPTYKDLCMDPIYIYIYSVPYIGAPRYPPYVGVPIERIPNIRSPLYSTPSPKKTIL